MFDFVNIKTIFLIAHLFGVVFGMGAAFMTDIMFLKSVKDKILSPEELSFLSLGSKVVWAGLSIIILSGIGLFYLDPENYLNSSKFLTKMFIVLVLTINGIFFHFKHLPLLYRQALKKLPESEEFLRKSSFLFVSGAISSISWISTLILGVFRGIPYEFGVLVSVYLVVILFGVVGALILLRVFLSDTLI